MDFKEYTRKMEKTMEVLASQFASVRAGRANSQVLDRISIPYYGVKEAVFPFNMFPEVDPILGPEMRSTGEVLGLSHFYGEAFFKAQEATQTQLPLSGRVLISVSDKDKDEKKKKPVKKGKPLSRVKVKRALAAKKEAEEKQKNKT